VARVHAKAVTSAEKEVNRHKEIQALRTLKARSSSTVSNKPNKRNRRENE
jgi:hypothetical protein